jgi:aspartate oxidase
MDSADMDVAIQDSNAVIASYSDNESISDYAKKGVASCVSMGVVSGRTADTIAPGNTISRAEVATIIERMLQKADLIN